MDGVRRKKWRILPGERVGVPMPRCSPFVRLLLSNSRQVVCTEASGSGDFGGNHGVRRPRLGLEVAIPDIRRDRSEIATYPSVRKFVPGARLPKHRLGLEVAIRRSPPIGRYVSSFREQDSRNTGGLKSLAWTLALDVYPPHVVNSVTGTDLQRNRGVGDEHRPTERADRHLPRRHGIASDERQLLEGRLSHGPKCTDV